MAARSTKIATTTAGIFGGKTNGQVTSQSQRLPHWRSFFRCLWGDKCIAAHSKMIVLTTERTEDDGLPLQAEEEVVASFPGTGLSRTGDEAPLPGDLVVTNQYVSAGGRGGTCTICFSCCLAGAPRGWRARGPMS